MEQVMQSTQGDKMGFQVCRGCNLSYPLDCLHPTIGGWVLFVAAASKAAHDLIRAEQGAFTVLALCMVREGNLKEDV